MVLVLLKSSGIGEVYLLSILYGEVKFPVLSLGSVGCRVKKQFKNLDNYLSAMQDITQSKLVDIMLMSF